MLRESKHSQEIYRVFQIPNRVKGWRQFHEYFFGAVTHPKKNYEENYYNF